MRLGSTNSSRRDIGLFTSSLRHLIDLNHNVKKNIYFLAEVMQNDIPDTYTSKQVVNTFLQPKHANK